MNLLFLYGPPASGKKTVGYELASQLDYKILDNHKTVEMVRQLFPFEDPILNVIRRRLQIKFRLEMYEEAAKAKVDFVATCAVAGEKHFDFYRETKEIIEKHGGKVYFVQLMPSREAMLERVTHPSRKNLKIETTEHLQALWQNEPWLFEKFPDEPHLTLDNSSLSPVETAEAICQYYNLSPRES